VFSTVLPVFALSAAIRLLNPGKTALIGSLGPIATLFMAWAWLNEPVSTIQLVGSAMVLAGVWLIGRVRRPVPARA
ncbi:MAG: DMT family transporter, partial [Betaproteobacteria bacterium]|nr:DMT family transporter [Betaproteobacteria bacterium]